MEHGPIVQRRGPPAAGPDALGAGDFAVSLVFSFRAGEHRGSARGFCLGERRIVTSRCRVPAGAQAGETEASRGLDATLTLGWREA